MKFLRAHWYDLGGVLAPIVAAVLWAKHETLSSYQLLMWLHLIALFLHQLEEYRIAGTFPGMINTALYKSDLPDRYPLNTQTAFIVNVAVGWTVYGLAAVFSERAVWLGIAAMAVSLGNVVAHTTLFNIKGKTLYNAGLATCWLAFAPCIGWFAILNYTQHLAAAADWVTGLALGVFLNVVGILKMIDWLADRNTSYIFEQRNLLPCDR